ncbi:calcium sensing receptor, chloroplastic [Salvia hispanica]|uniref:calcium sensing receptor, chloroplastic n=1 Tax=Salvia hispanica TaxID=49212 RepID=UPI0020095C36|nr:calcium sensing receptor, chloroplastic [Salvia hispanica]
MALRVTSTARPPSLPPSPPLSSPPPKTVSVPSKLKISSSRPHQLAPASLSVPPAAVLPLFALFAAPDASRAEILPKEQIVSSLTQVESAIDKIGEVGGSLLSGAGELFGAVKPGLDAAVPILKQAGEQAVKIASPVVSEATKKAQEAMQSSGFDTEPVMTAAKTVADAAQQTTKVIDEAKPIATSTVQTISAAEPVVILATGGALVIAYFLLPPVLSAISFNLRGYQGFLSPAQTLDLMSAKNYILVDIRSEKDKNKAGVPRLPSSAKNNLISIPLEELPNKVRSLVRNVKKVEAELVALKISYLKKINKGSNIVILDSYCESAKTVAKTLTKLGFKNTWIVTDGFSGSKGWLQSRLGTDSYNLSFAEVISPSRVISSASRKFGTTSTKLLPGASD